MPENDILAEPAEAKRNAALNAKLLKQNSVKLSDLNGKFVVIKEVTDYGDLFVDEGDQVLIFGIVNGNVYHISNDPKKFNDQVADPTKGELVIELDSDKNQINWRQDHIEQQPFESYNSLRSSKYYGDAGYPLLQALEAHVHGTYNISGYDTRLVTAADLVEDLKSNAAPASSAASTPTTPASRAAAAPESTAKSAASSAAKSTASSASSTAKSAASSAAKSSSASK